MRRINFFIAISAFSFLMLCLPGIASAQYGGYDPYGRNGGYGNGQYDPYYGRNGRNNNGRYGDMRSVVRDLKNRAGQFERALDRDLDNSRYNGSRREDQINALARDFRNAVNRLDSNGRSGDINRVLDLGYQIDRTIGRSRIGYSTQQIWSGIRYDLDALRNGYGYNDRNRNRGYGNNRNNLPGWWPF
jgi:hypothetical protein